MLRLFPPTWVTDDVGLEGAQGTNWPYGIRIKPGTSGSIYAQEIYEWRFRFAAFIIPVILGVLLLPGLFKLAGVIAGMLLSLVLINTRWPTRWIEIRGYAVSIAVERKYIGVDWIRSYATQIQSYDHYHMTDLSVDEIVNRLNKAMPSAERWIDRAIWKSIIENYMRQNKEI